MRKEKYELARRASIEKRGGGKKKSVFFLPLSAKEENSWKPNLTIGKNLPSSALSLSLFALCAPFESKHARERHRTACRTPFPTPTTGNKNAERREIERKGRPFSALSLVACVERRHSRSRPSFDSHNPSFLPRTSLGWRCPRARNHNTAVPVRSQREGESLSPGRG